MVRSAERAVPYLWLIIADLIALLKMGKVDITQKVRSHVSPPYETQEVIKAPSR